MNDTNIQIGLDPRGKTVYAARVETNSGRPEIKALVRFDSNRLENHKLLDGGKRIIAIDDRLTYTHRIHMDDRSGDIKAKVGLELISMLHDDPANYYFDYAEGDTESTLFGVALRKKTYTSLLEQLFENRDTIDIQSGRLRSLGLVQGYRKFCRPVGGDLICLLDLTGDSILLVFLHKNRLLDISTLAGDKYDLSQQADQKKLVVELKTILNYKISSFFEEGITVPLSHLVCSGEDIDEHMFGLLRNSFKVAVSRPELNSGYLQMNRENNPPLFGNYLVALGLTQE